ncbi:MAG: RHS repeat-associated core domain-containing protein [Candidatus Didemnitutus sp.]|nr:RHS repeat-associated core domain-containing protein [Candidatus Didemnitutus sp.]
MGATLRRRPCATPTTRALNQYTRKENNSVRVTGTAASNANVAFLGTMSTTRVGRTWANSIDPANISGPAVGLATAFATVPGGPLGAQSYTYDANGNLAFGGGRTVTWTSFNQLLRADMAGGKFSEFAFGAGRERVKQTSQLGTTTYVGALFERFTPAGAGAVTENKHYIFTPAGRVAVYTERSDLTRDTRWFHTDGLGSITAVTNEAGAIVKRFAFDAWGKRLTPSTNGVITTNAATGSTASGGYTRGYTDHEQLDDLGLIHMNGRVYDPTLGRFLSADPHVDDATDAQGFNRYSYVGNNPMNATDPSGYFKLKEILPAVIGIVVAVVVTAFLGPQGGMAVFKSWGALFGGLKAGFGTAAAIWGGAAGGFASGFSGSLLNGGSVGDAFKAGVIGAAVGAATAWAAGQIADIFNNGSGIFADEMFANWAGRTAAHGAVGGLAAEAQGGQFRHGFLSSAAAAGIMHIRSVGRFFQMDKGGGWIAARTAAAAAIGGTASVLGGGKFANGAVTSAFQHLFNSESSRKEPRREAWLFEEQADVFGGTVAGSIGKYHQWLATFEDGKLVFAAGLGNAEGVPGEASRLPDLPGLSKGYIKDHSHRNNTPGVMATRLYNVDFNALNSYLSMRNASTGPWLPLMTDCNVFVSKVRSWSTPQVYKGQSNMVRWADGTWRKADSVLTK